MGRFWQFVFEKIATTHEGGGINQPGLFINTEGGNRTRKLYNRMKEMYKKTMTPSGGDETKQNPP